MIQFAIIRALDGTPLCLRLSDAKDFSMLDHKYGLIVIPEFENEVIGNAILDSPPNKDGFHVIPEEQLGMIRSLAAPLFPELFERDINEGEEWKKG